MDFLLTPTWQRFKSDLEELELISEKSVQDQENRYKGLSLQALYTSFDDLINIFNHPAVKGRWVDLGGGSGRSCLLYSFMTAQESFNLEIDWARAKITDLLAKKYNLKASSRVCNLEKDPILEGDTYFLYFPTGHTLDRILHILASRVDFTLVVIESHGDLIARTEKEKGYQLVDKLPLTTPRHDPFIYIYKKLAVIDAQEGPHQLSFQDELLVLTDQQGEWVASSYGLEWLGGDRYQFQHPPRAISWSLDFKGKVAQNSQAYPLLKNLNAIRKLGEVRIELANGQELTGVIRKIRLSDPIRLEISTAELIEWQSILRIFKGSHLCYESSSFLFSLPAP